MASKNILLRNDAGGGMDFFGWIIAWMLFLTIALASVIFAYHLIGGANTTNPTTNPEKTASDR